MYFGAAGPVVDGRMEIVMTGESAFESAVDEDEMFLDEEGFETERRNSFGDTRAGVEGLDCLFFVVVVVVEGRFVLVAVAEVIARVGTKIDAILSCSDIFVLT